MPKKKTLEDYRKELYALKRKHDDIIANMTKQESEILASIKNVKYLKKYAEKAGTETFKWKSKFLRLEEKYNKIETELKNLKKVNKK